MDRVKMLQNPLPIDRVAARVVKKAKPEDLWRPMPKAADHLVPPGSVLATAPLSMAAIKSNPALVSVPGSRRGRMLILGYAAEQSALRNTGARWVARCDCGNQEYRSRILRWLGTDAPDMCRECRNRIYKMRGEFFQREPAMRATAPNGKGHAPP